MVPFSTTKTALTTAKDATARALATEAKTLANNATTSAANSKAAADAASASASAANTTANTANSTANTAQSIAANAKAIAEASQTAANAANTALNNYVKKDGTTPIVGPQTIEGKATVKGGVRATTTPSSTTATEINSSGVTFPDGSLQASAAFTKTEQNATNANMAGLINTAQTKADSAHTLATTAKATADAAAPQSTTYTKSQIDAQFISFLPGGTGTVDSAARTDAQTAITKADTAKTAADAAQATADAAAPKNTVYTKTETTSEIASAIFGSLKKIANLSDLNDVPTARTNLGLGTAALSSTSDFATAAQGALAETAKTAADNAASLVNAQTSLVNTAISKADSAKTASDNNSTSITSLQNSVASLQSSVGSAVKSVTAGTGGVTVTGTATDPIINVIQFGYTDQQIDDKDADVKAIADAGVAAAAAAQTTANTAVTKADTAQSTANAGIIAAATAQAKADAAAPQATTYTKSEVDTFIAAKTAQITAEENRALAAEGVLQSTLNNVISNTDAAALDSLTEIVAAFQAADGTLNGSLTALTTTMNGKFTTEEAARIAGDLVNSTAIGNETVRAKAKEDQLQTSIDNILGGTLQANLDSLKELLDEFQAGDQTLNTAITNLSNTLQANLNTEAATRATADTTLANEIITEATTRATNDTTLQTNIDAEATTRAANDTTLQTNITDEATARSTADTTLQANITAEETRALAAEALKVNRSGDTMTGDFVTKTSGTSAVDIGNLSGNYSINFSTAEYYTATVTGNVTFSFSNSFTSTRVVIIKLKDAGSYTISFPSGTKFTNNTAPTLTTGYDTLAIEYSSALSAYFVHVVGKGA